MRIEIPRQVEWILTQLNNHGYEAFAVGGCVRDTLLLKVPEDWDITTSAKPEQVKEIFSKTIDTGIKHGTVTVLKDHVGYEITTYRIDGEYEDGRHPKEVAFTTDLQEDLKRRDFTINAMAYSHQTGIVDLYGGMRDLEKKIIRCVGDATERFTEDALRILRAIRFSAQLGFIIEKGTYDVLADIAPNLAHVSKERIQVELTKTLLSEHPERILLADETGMSPYISKTFPKVIESIRKAANRRKEQGGSSVVFDAKVRMNADAAKRMSTDAAVWLHAVARTRQDKTARFAAFLYTAEEAEAKAVLKELRMDNDTINKVKTLVHWLPLPLSDEPSLIRKVMSSMSEELFDALLELKRVMLPDTEQSVERAKELSCKIREAGDCLRLKDLAVNGSDLMEAGMKPGQELGEKLVELFELVLKYPEYNTKDYLLTLARNREDS